MLVTLLPLTTNCGHLGSPVRQSRAHSDTAAVIPEHLMWFLTLAFCSESEILPLAIAVQLLSPCWRWDEQHCEHSCLLSRVILVSAGDCYKCTLQAVPAGKKLAPVLCPSVNQCVRREPHPDPSAQIHLFPSATVLYAFHRTSPQNCESSSRLSVSYCNRWARHIFHNIHSGYSSLCYINERRTN